MSSKTYRITFVVVVVVLTAVFVAAVALAQPPAGRGQRPGGERRQGSDGGQIFERLRAADTNGDGTISAAEVKAAGLPERLVQALDSNRDGAVTRDELAARGRGREGGGERGRGRGERGAQGERGQGRGGAGDRPGISDDLAQALKKADTDRNGYVSREEFKKAAPRASQSLYDRLDGNKDGKLARDEIARVSRLPQQDSRPGPDPVRQLRELMSSFDKIDADKNGELSMAELQAGKVKMPVEGFKRLDADRDAAISRNEVRRAIEMAGRGTQREGRGGQEGRGPAAGQRLAQADLNRDGRITRQEFKEAIPRAPAEAFDRLDSNKDGAITKDELARMQQGSRGGQNRQRGPEGGRRQGQTSERRRRPEGRSGRGPQSGNRPSRSR